MFINYISIFLYCGKNNQEFCCKATYNAVVTHLLTCQQRMLSITVAAKSASIPNVNRSVWPWPWPLTFLFENGKLIYSFTSAREIISTDNCRNIDKICMMAPLYFPKLIQINYELMLRIKWLWLVPNLMQVLAIFLKFQAVKQSGPCFWPSLYVENFLRLQIVCPEGVFMASLMWSSVSKSVLEETNFCLVNFSRNLFKK